MRGWLVVGALTLLVVAGYALGTWALFAGIGTWIVDDMVLGASGDGLSRGLAFVLMAVGFIGGTVVQVGVTWASLWARYVDISADPEGAAAYVGAAVGAASAIPAFASPAGAAIAAIAAVVLGAFGVRAVRGFVADVRASVLAAERRARITSQGTKVCAQVTGVDPPRTWIVGSPVFEVTAAYSTPSGEQTVRHRVMTDPAGAPVVGGTVLVWFEGDGSDLEHTVMTADPASVRDPDAGEKYRSPD